VKKNVTIYTIAEELGVTPTSVSRAFNPESKLNAVKRKLILDTALQYGFKPNTMASRLSKREISIGVLIYSYFEPYYADLTAGIRDAYDGLKDYKIKYDLRLVDSKTNEPSVCVDILDEFSRNHYDGILVNDLHSAVSFEKLNCIYETNPNIAFMNFDTNNIPRLFASVYDVEAAGKTAAELLSVTLRFSESRNVMIFTDDIFRFSQKRIQTAFCAEAEKAGLSVIGRHEVKTFRGLIGEDSSGDGGFFHHVDGIFVSCGNSEEICGYIEKIPPAKRPVLITYDAYPELISYIRKGIITATIFQDTYQQAKTAFQSLFFHLLDGRKIPSVVNTGFSIVMKNNIEVYSREK